MKKYFILIFLLAIGFIPLNFIHSQSNFKDIVQNSQVLAEKTFDLPLRKIYSNDSNLIAIGTQSQSERKGTVTIFDMQGNELWEKIFEGIHHVSLAKTSEKIIVSHDYNLEEEGRNTCFDLQGNKLWEVLVTDPGLTQSSDGRYAITTRVSGEEFSGKFQVFDMESGKEMPTPIKKDYRPFFAQFLNNNQVALVLQKKVYSRDLEALKEINRLKSEKKEKEAFELARKTNKGFRLESESLEFLVYDIPTSSVIVKKQLTLVDGSVPDISPDADRTLIISDKGNFISIAVMKSGGRPNIILLIDNLGETNNVITDFDYILDMEFFNDRWMVILDGQSIVLYDLETKTKLWRQDAKKFSERIRTLSLSDENQIEIQTSHISDQGISNLFILNLITGQNIEEPKTSFAIIKNTLDSKIIFEISLNKIIFLK
ncbi:MAG: hypothetical protein KGZ58_05810 [Ignavibacteriales bacterium]|nr:hypothetical protein [Ignavibacteriales bacterium]